MGARWMAKGITSTCGGVGSGWGNGLALKKGMTVEPDTGGGWGGSGIGEGCGGMRQVAMRRLSGGGKAGEKGRERRGRRHR